jgi:hypothetical protein
MHRQLLFTTLLLTFSNHCTGQSPGGAWRDQVLPVELGVGYAVKLIDLSQDGRLDIAIVDSKRIIWLENPSWQVHVISATPDAAYDNVCFAPHDVDGDGKIDLAIGSDWQFGNSDSGGHIGWLHSPVDPRKPWQYYPLAEEPTTHRMRWIDWDHDGKPELAVVPLKGRGTRPPGFQQAGVRLLLLSPPANPLVETWNRSVLDDSLHVAHNLDVVDFDENGADDLLVGSFEGVTLLERDQNSVRKTRLGSGQPGEAPAIGASEIRCGNLSTKERYLATIEPWHGDHVVVYTKPQENHSLWNRHVLDHELKWGHAVACSNLDDDEEQELIIGVRDNLGDQHRSGVRIYDPVDAAQGKWNRQLLFPGQVAVEDLDVGDLDGDGDTDIVAVGRATHNAVIYWNPKK